MNKPNKKHGNTGNRYAAKPEAEKVTAESLSFTAPAGTRRRIVKWAQSRGHRAYAAAVREYLLEMLDAEGF